MTLTIQDLGALGELLGSVAVLVTHVYLAIQVRHGKELLNRSDKIALSQARQSRLDSRRDLERLVMEKDMAEILVKSSLGSKSEELTEVERFRVPQLHWMWMDWWDNNIYQEALGLDEIVLNMEQFEELLAMWKAFDLPVSSHILEWAEGRRANSAPAA